MRVERFSLFFPPLIVAKPARARPSTRIGVDPARRLREDHRDEPGGGAPAGGRARAPTTASRCGSAIVVIAAGPAMNLAARVPDPAGCCSGAIGTAEATSTVERRRSRSQPAAAGAAGPATGSSPSTACERRHRRRCARRSPSTRCAGTPSDGCQAATPARVTVERDGQRRTVRDPAASTTPRAKRTRLGFAFDGQRRPRRRPGARGAATAVDDDVARHERTVARSRGSSSPRSASRSRSVVGGYEVTRQAFDFDTERALHGRWRSSASRWRSSTCSRSCRSTAGTSSGRWSRRCAAGRSRSRSWSGRASSASCS